tara:strand:+ start:143 stop:547 length:405 start_codon:yes stop_codon:yes gene_type:complete
MVWTIIKGLDRGNARNWPGFIILDPDAPYPAAVWAQERYEAGWKMNPFHLIRFHASAKARRELEIRGHEIEVQAAHLLYDAPIRKTRQAEAAALTKYDDFKGRSEDWIFRQMRKEADWAKAWVRDHEADIRQYL